jgi:hypothetical protein
VIDLPEQNGHAPNRQTEHPIHVEMVMHSCYFKNNWHHHKLTLINASDSALACTEEEQEKKKYGVDNKPA